MIYRQTSIAWIPSATSILVVAASLLLVPTIQAAPNQYNVQDIPLFKHGVGKQLEDRMQTAKSLAALEQSVEDFNAQWIASASSEKEAVTYRRLIAMPLSEIFDPAVMDFSHGHIQTGDKMSLPSCFYKVITLNKAEVPWLFEVSRIEGVTRPRVEDPAFAKDEDGGDDDDEGIQAKTKKSRQCLPSDVGAAPPLKQLDKVVGGPLDFRSPSNYVFLPWWMMRALGLRPRDIVDVRQIGNVPPGSMAKFRPLTSQTLKDITNPQAVLETELRHYSSLVQGSTIAFDYNKKRYWFEVAECRSAPRGEKQPAIKVQDCDIATEYLPPRDTIKQRKKNRDPDQ